MKRRFTYFILLFFSMISAFAAGHFDFKQLTIISTDALLKTSLSAAQQKTLDNLIQAKTPIPGEDGVFTKITAAVFAKKNDATCDYVFIGQGQDEKQFGLYLMHAGKLTVIATHKTEIPKGAGFFNLIRSINFDEKTGTIVFIGEGILEQQGIYAYEKKELTKLVDQQSVVPEAKSIFRHFYGVSYINGIAVFSADGDASPNGVYVYYQGDSYQLINPLDKINNKTVNSYTIIPESFTGSDLFFSVQFADRSMTTFRGILRYK